MAVEGRSSSFPQQGHFGETTRRIPEEDNFEKKTTRRLPEKEHFGGTRRRRSPNLGIATLALDAFGDILGIEALGSSISPAEAALALFATRKLLICVHLIQFARLFGLLYLHTFQLLYPQTPFTNG